MSDDSKYDVSSEVVELRRTIEIIGLARFVGRINSGLIPSWEGYAVVEQFVDQANVRPFVSRLSNLLFHRRESHFRR
ncbi:MAG: hypothetical protein O9337_02470 [Acidovorax sp.]|uniref:hypothetical protein n=1 Tax=Acidovorax sp. TaxID=1872122 RepID=UPI0022BE7995|nr:hypothetical protein [Acidovorax sp.]MCZ8218259.1 hypothetical protein [Acidovorax sp.]